LLDLDGALRRQAWAAVEVRAEGDAILGDLAQLLQRHDLEAAGIGEDRSRPVHEPVQAAQPRDPLGAGAQHQVIGVAEDDLGAGGAAPAPASVAFTVPAVPTVMNAGVSTGHARW
jgi:hypothetical protein